MSADPEPAPTSQASVAAQWARFLKAKTELERRGPAVDEFDEEWDDLFRIEKFVLCGPICDRADAIAKLEATARSLSVGERTDGADQAAIASVIRWLQTFQSAPR
jgi:hypothetical protein